MIRQPDSPAVTIRIWTDRVRAARAAQAAFLAAAQAYDEQPTPSADPWFGDYRRVLANAEVAKAEAADAYAEHGEAVIADLLRLQDVPA